MITVSNGFHNKAQGQVIQPVPKLSISFNKTTNNVQFFTLDQSVLNGVDILNTSEDNPIQLWDKYDYDDYSDRIVDIDVERSVEFPYGTQSAMADITLNNYDKYFTPDSTSAIATNNLPGRPLRISAGFTGAEIVPQFVGLTQKMPVVNTKNATVQYHAVDFLSAIADQTLNDIVVMRDARTDQVLAKIVEQLGVLPSQYSFEMGKNIIPFVFFNEGQSAGDAIKQLVQAENGKFWLDELGILRFASRDNTPNESSLTLDDYSIISCTTNDYSNIVNHIIVSCDMREVQEFQTVYTKTPSGDSVNTNWVIGANSTSVKTVKLEDPCYSIVTPQYGTAKYVSWFNAKNTAGTIVAGNVSVTSTKISTNSYEMTFSNTNNFPVEINELVLWGEPAKVYDHLEYDSYEDVSVAKYGEHKMSVADNPFFQSYNQAVSFSGTVLSQRAFYTKSYTMEIKGDFSLQLKDVFDVTGKYAGTYEIDSITWQLSNGNLSTALKVHSVPHYEYFRLDVDQLDGTKVLK